jgi:histidinol-phosphate aminotransferase
MLVRLRSAVDESGAYRPPPLPVSPAGETFRLAANEAAYPPLPAVQDAIARAVGAGNRYPDNGCTELVNALAEHVGVSSDRVAVGAGSIGVLQALFAAACEPGTNVVYGWRSFEAFPGLVRWSGATGRPVALREERHDLAAMAASVDDQTRLVIVCNPNNPTGTAVSAAELATFLAAIPPDVVVVLDEAYHDYAGDAVPDGVELTRAWPNVVALRTFSKAHALAGLRVGYAVAHPDIVEAVRRARVPFAVGQLAQVAALESLRHHQEIGQRSAEVVVERERVVAELHHVGLAIPRSFGNFVWLPLGERTEALVRACRTAGVAVHHFADEGVRATIGSPADNDGFLSVVTDFARADSVPSMSGSADFGG